MESLSTTWEQICIKNNIDTSFVPQFLEVEERFRKKHIANWKLDYICEDLNGKDFVFDFSDLNQEKYLIVLSWEKGVSASRFWCARTFYGSESALAGNRLFRSRVSVEHMAKYFLQELIDATV